MKKEDKEYKNCKYYNNGYCCDMDIPCTLKKFNFYSCDGLFDEADTKSFNNRQIINLNELDIEKLKKEYKQKMFEALDKDEETGHLACDSVLCDLLNDLGFNNIVKIWKAQDKWYC